MTGLSGSGKTTISEALEKDLLFKHGKNVYRIDGDNLRTGLTRDLGFSAADRGESVRRAAEVAALFNEAGVITMVTLISPYRKDRDAARAMHEKRGLPFMEVTPAQPGRPPLLLQRRFAICIDLRIASKGSRRTGKDVQTLPVSHYAQIRAPR